MNPGIKSFLTNVFLMAVSGACGAGIVILLDKDRPPQTTVSAAVALPTKEVLDPASPLQLIDNSELVKKEDYRKKMNEATTVIFGVAWLLEKKRDVWIHLFNNNFGAETDKRDAYHILNSTWKKQLPEIREETSESFQTNKRIVSDLLGPLSSPPPEYASAHQELLNLFELYTRLAEGQLEATELSQYLSVTVKWMKEIQFKYERLSLMIGGKAEMTILPPDETTDSVP